MNEQLKIFIDGVFASNELNRLPQSFGGGRIFSAPLLGVSRGDDDIFGKFKEIIGPEHLTPSEMWKESRLPEDENLAKRLRIVSLVFPYVGKIREEGEKNSEDVPPEIYCVARNFANPFMNAVLEQIEGYFKAKGFRAISGMKSGSFQILREKTPFRIYSNWSERHIAFASGLGTFSLHEGLITEAGCNIRLASVITDAPLEITPRLSDEPYSNCLHYANGECGSCMDKCPAAAITEDGHDKHKCLLNVRKVSEEMQTRSVKSWLKPHHRVMNGEVAVSYPVGCALCQFGVPCTNKNPVSAKEEAG
jgi:epoxyqueuosine reductase QueG